MRIVRRANDVALQFRAQHRGVARLHASGHRAPRVGERLVAVEAAQLHAFAVQEETAIGEAGFPESDTGVERVAVVEPRGHLVQFRMFQVPELQVAQTFDGDLIMAGGGAHHAGRRLYQTVAVTQFGGDSHRFLDRPVDIAADHHGAIVGNRADRLGEDIRQVSPRYHAQLHVAVDAAEGEVVDHAAEGWDVGALGGVDLHGQQVVRAELQVGCQLEGERRVPAAVLLELVTVDADFSGGHHAAEIGEDAFAAPCRRRAEMPLVQGDELVGLVVKTVPWQFHVAVGQGDAGGALGAFARKQPVAVQRIDAARRNGASGILCLC